MTDINSSPSWPKDDTGKQLLHPRRAIAGIPPWMWGWCIVFLLSIPQRLDSAWRFAQSAENDILQGIENLVSLDPQAARLSVLVYPLYSSLLIDFLPHMALVLGIVTVLVPRLRAKFLERTNGLVEPPSVPSLLDIARFMQQRAPGLGIKVNLARQGRIWIYPTSWRRANLAIFAGFVLQWKRQRQSAEAMLEHELAHYRRGDALFLGPGNILEVATKVALALFAVIVAVPNAVIYTDQALLTYRQAKKVAALERELHEQQAALGIAPSNHDDSGVIEPSLLGHLLPVGGTFLLSTLSFLMWTASAFAVPVACMWAAELNADLLASRTPILRTAILSALADNKGAISWWRRALFRISHPPNALRRALIRHGGSRGLLFALLLVPAAIVLQDGIIRAWAGLNRAFLHAAGVLGEPASDYLKSHSSLTSPLTWLALSVFLVAWPTLAPWWERLANFDGETIVPPGNVERLGEAIDSRVDAIAPTRFAPYALAAGFCGVVAITTVVITQSTS